MHQSTHTRWPRPLLLAVALLSLPMWQCYLDPAALTKLENPIRVAITPALPCDSLATLQKNPAYGERFSKMFAKQPRLWGCLVPLDPKSYTLQKEGVDSLVQPVWFDASSKLYTFSTAAKKLVPAVSLSLPIDYVRNRTYARLFVGKVQDKAPSKTLFEKLQAQCKQFLVPDFNCFSKEGQAICWFTLDFQPKATSGATAFGAPTEGKDKPCKLCSPETCDGQDNDCNSKSDDTIIAEYACQEGLQCLKGTCACETTGTNYCPDLKRCVDFKSDAKHCGKCNNACKTEQKCDAGKCVCNTENLTFCDVAKGCVNLQTDPKHCGTCGNACFAGQECKSGKCVCAKTDQVFCPDFRRCIDTQNDPKHCGGCGKHCFNDQKCVAGKCVCNDPKKRACFGGKLCTGIQNDSSCGACGNRCLGDATCNAGVCECTPKAYLECDGVCTNPDRDEHCGSCNNSSTEGNCFSGKACKVENGKCTCIGKNGAADPNKNPNQNYAVCGNFCANLRKSREHCGQCDRKCDPGKNCVGGKCIVVKFLLCDKKKTFVEADPNHCGKCDNKCPDAQQCDKGTCKCPRNFTFCGASCINTLENAENCGGCGTKCKPEQTCTKGKCQ